LALHAGVGNTCAASGSKNPLKKEAERKNTTKIYCMRAKKRRPSPSRFLMHHFAARRALHSPCLSPSAQACGTKLRSWYAAHLIRAPLRAHRRRGSAWNTADPRSKICRVHRAGCEVRMLWRTYAADRAATASQIGSTRQRNVRK